MATRPTDRSGFTLVTAGMALVTVVAGTVAAVQPGPPPPLALVLPCVALAVVGANISPYFPAKFRLSPLLLFVMAAVAGAGPRHVVLSAMLVGLAGAAVRQMLERRRWAVLVCNAAIYSLSSATAAAAYLALDDAHVSAAPRDGAAVLVYMATNLLLVIPALAIRHRVRPRAFLRDTASSSLPMLVLGVAGLLVGRLYLSIGPIALATLVGPLVLAQSVLVSMMRSRQAYERLESVYSFTKRLQRTLDEGDAVATLLGELSTVVGAQVAEVTLLGERGAWRRVRFEVDQADLVHEDGFGTPAEIEATRAGPVLTSELRGYPLLRRALARRGLDGAMLAPLSADSSLLGVVAAARHGGGERFGADALRMLDTLASHAAVSLANSRLLAQLRLDSRRDHLTGLANRTRFSELADEIAPPGAVLLIDLDRFKEINDTLGHSAGDEVLRSVADRLRSEVGDRGVVARLGGDEFGILLHEVTASDAAQAAVALLSALEHPFEVGGLGLELTASIGVALVVPADRSPGKLLQRADVAMYAAKAAHSGWELYSPERDHYSPQRLALAGELRRAIDTNQLEVHYQPKASLRTGAICGLEALVRWRHPRYGLISPDQFVPIAERTGLIRSMTLLVLADAARVQAQVRAAGRDLHVAVNLSVRSLVDVSMPDEIARVLAEHHMDADRLVLEITEGSLMADPARSIGILGRLAALGARISIDDFGTGYSSLAYLKRLPATEVKVDRSFVAGLLTNDSDAAIVRSTVDLARNLGLRAVAEGVEDGQTWSRLAAIGCDEAQGYYISPALPAPNLLRWLARTERVGGRSF